MSIIVNGVELTEVIYAGVNLDIVKVKKGAAEAVTVFEKITQLATPQNVTADGTVVSWDEVENATSYAVLADGASIGTVEKAANGYNVEISYSNPKSGVGFYSLDNGVTWKDIYEQGKTQITLNNVKQIKFKAEDDGSYYSSISSTALGFSIYSGYNDGAIYSNNFELTEDITDVYFSSGSD